MMSQLGELFPQALVTRMSKEDAAYLVLCYFVHERNT